MTTEAEEMIKRLSGGRAKGKRVTLYVNTESYAAAKKICDQNKISISNVVSAYLKDFVESALIAGTFNAGQSAAKKLVPAQRELFAAVSELSPTNAKVILGSVLNLVARQKSKDRSNAG